MNAPTYCPTEVGYCPACGDPMDYCQGHGDMGDPWVCSTGRA